MKNNDKLGMLLSILGIIAGGLLFYFMAKTYNNVIYAHVNVGRPDEGNTVRFVYALLGWLGTTAGAMWAAVLYGFSKKENWAWYVGMIAATIQLLAGFFPAIPAADSGLPVPTLIVFGIAGLLWFSMLAIGGIHRKIVTLTFIAGLAYVLTFIDGVAPISKYQTSEGFWNGIYVMAQQVNWWGAWAWAIFIFATIKQKSWAIPVGIFAALMSIIGGYPMGIYNVFEVQRFSMFLPAPIISTGLLVYLLLPKTREMVITGGRNK